MVKGSFKCPKCSRTFGMAGHLGRHMSAIHGVKSAKAAPKGEGRGRGRPKGARKAGPGRPSGLSTRMGLRSMSLDQLSELISEARDEARRKLVAMKDLFA